MRAGRSHGRLRRGGTNPGFSLIELMVAVAVMAVLAALALPSFTDWIRNNQVRVAAETLREGLQLARSEAVKRNTRVRLQWVSSLDNTCALNTSGPYWVVNAGAAITPAGNCGAAVGQSASPFIVQSSPVTASASKVTVSSSAPVVAFDGSGRLSSTTNPTTSPGTFKVNLGIFPISSCVENGGNLRCLQVVVTLAGEVRMCDPAQTGLTNPTRCY